MGLFGQTINDRYCRDPGAGPAARCPAAPADSAFGRAPGLRQGPVLRKAPPPPLPSAGLRLTARPEHGPRCRVSGLGPAVAEGQRGHPTLNEARILPHVFAELPPGLHEVIIVDGNSVDDTVATARRLRPDVRIVRQNRCGKGNALACGFAAETGDIIAMVDADGSADPAEIPQFVQALLDGADFAKGTRFDGGGGSSDITRLRRLGNRVLRPAWSTRSAGPSTPTCATATTPSGAATSRCSACTPNPTSRSAAAPGCGATDLKSRP